MKIFRIHQLLLLCAILLPTVGIAKVPLWQIEPGKSSLAFVATQNNAPISGEFKSFSGTIAFSPEQLADSHVNIVVDIASVTTSYGEVADTLKTPDWFDVKLFPQAVFHAAHFIKTGEKTYEAQGQLTIRDKTNSVTLTFELDAYDPQQTLVKGSTTLHRTAFGVGRGDWVSTDAVNDEVTVNFSLTAKGQ